jgi:adenine-specific DNA-methyltransferase
MNFIENESVQKLRGGYYTPPAIARFLARWVLEGRAETILEPSCGDGVFVDAMYQPGVRPPKSLTACELDAVEAAKTKRRGLVHHGLDLHVQSNDFLGWALSRFDRPAEFDGVVGNPPFIRYQYLEASLQAQSEKIFARFGLPFTKHTNAWVPFVIASIALLQPGGRLAMVVPAELLHVIHAQSLRRFLLERCARVLVIDPEQLLFGEALQGVVLLLAERAADNAARDGALAIAQVRTNEFLDESPSKIFDGADFIPGAALGAKWMLALLTPSERRLLLEVAQRPNVHRFADIASVDVGIVTGSNKFFLVPDAVVQEFDLEPWAFPMFGRSNHVQGVIYDRQHHDDNRALGLPTNFLWFPADDAELNDGARRYIRQGEAEALQARYKCRIRKPWYRVPSVHSTPVGMLKRCHHFPRLVLNQANAFTTDTAYRIQPRGVEAAALVACFVNSLTALTAELEGRHYGGGVLELVPSEIERLLVPIPVAGADALLANLDEKMRKEAPAEALLSAQDRKVLRPLGLRKSDCEDLLAAWSRIRNRRQRTPGEEAIAS